MKFILLLFTINVTLGHEGLNDRPIIAILAQLAPPYYNVSYIAASYVKYLEGNGARVVPIPASMSLEEAATIFDSVNGVLFPGGHIKWFTSGYYRHAKLFYDKAIEANKAGDYFPIWGTCLGFETLHVLTANNESVLGDYLVEDVPLPLILTVEATKSRLFKNIPIDLYKAVSTQPITYNSHLNGVGVLMYTQTESLKSFYDILSVNKFPGLETFVSTIEAKNYPFYGTQWHPEKNNYEFILSQNVNHSPISIEVAQYMSMFFVNETRKSTHKFPSNEVEEKYLIYNYNPVYTGEYSTYQGQFAQVYYFI